MEAAKAVKRIALTVILVVKLFSQICPAAVCTGGGEFNLQIPQEPEHTNGWMKDAVIHVPHKHIISDLDVKVSITHTCAFDLKIFLVSPSGKAICLSMFNPDGNEFFKGEDYEQTIFDDEAPVYIKDGSPPFSGRYRPIEPFELSAFDGESTSGQWRLRINDAYFNDRGVLEYFELTFNNPEPSSALLFVGGGLIILSKKRPRS